MKALEKLTAHDVGFDVEAHLFGMWAAELDAADYGENRGRLWAELESHLGEALEPVERERARRRMLSGRPSQESWEGGEAIERVAATVGWSFLTLKLAREVVAAFRTSKHSTHVAA